MSEAIADSANRWRQETPGSAAWPRNAARFFGFEIPQAYR